MNNLDAIKNQLMAQHQDVIGSHLDPFFRNALTSATHAINTSKQVRDLAITFISEWENLQNVSLELEKKSSTTMKALNRQIGQIQAERNKVTPFSKEYCQLQTKQLNLSNELFAFHLSAITFAINLNALLTSHNSLTVFSYIHMDLVDLCLSKQKITQKKEVIRKLKVLGKGLAGMTPIIGAAIATYYMGKDFLTPKKTSALVQTARAMKLIEIQKMLLKTLRVQNKIWTTTLQKQRSSIQAHIKETQRHLKKITPLYSQYCSPPQT